MQVTLIETEGRGGVAQIALAGCRLRVVDALSAGDRPTPPGVLTGVRLEVVVIPHLMRSVSVPDGVRPRLEPEHGWRYHAIGEVVSTQPLCAEVGVLRLDLPEQPGVEWQVGDAVSIGIDRIILRWRGD